jgi:uncharacterized protein (TIGR02145 family)
LNSNALFFIYQEKTLLLQVKFFKHRAMKAELIKIFLFFILFLSFTSCKDSDSSVLFSEVLTNLAREITATSALVGGEVLNDGNSLIINRGIYYGTSRDVKETGTRISLGDGLGDFTTTLTNLEPGTSYFVRAFAENSEGVSLGNEISFSTLSSTDDKIFNPALTYGTLSDIDGNNYKTILIGTQEWMAENLKVIHYNDGSQIIEETENTLWDQLISGAFCWYYNLIESGEIYGALYNWYAVNTDKLCPTGWHIPSDEEWTTLTNLLGDEFAGGKLKEIGLQHWGMPLGGENVGATNESGFTALPGGIRGTGGGFFGIGYSGNWWSSSENDAATSWYRNMGYDFEYVYRNNSRKNTGKSVRCLKD